MTQDFLDDFTDAMVKENKPFIVIISNGPGNAHTRFMLGNWPSRDGENTRDDLHGIIDGLPWHEDGSVNEDDDEDRAVS